MVVAGPGSGKTEIIVRRVAHLISDRKVPIDSLLITTFTNRAAEQLKDRITRLLGRDVEDMQVSTIHSLCNRLLMEYHMYHPLGRGFRVLDGAAQFLYVYSNRRRLGIDTATGRMGRYISDVLNFFNTCTEGEVDPEELVVHARERLDRADEDSGEKAGEYLMVAEGYSRYLELLREEDLLDFGLLQRQVLSMFEEHPTALEEVRKNFGFVMIDEFQDTNPLQDRILRMIAEPENNIFVVGDEDQSIYRFRGATVMNLLRFPERYPACRRITLTRNFRSTENIVEISNELISHNPKRLKKDLVAHRETGQKVILVHEETWPREADSMARVIRMMRDEGVIGSYGDVAVLFSSVKYHAGEYGRAFQENGVPYVMIGDGSFLTREDVRGVIDLINWTGWERCRRPDFFHGPPLDLTGDALEALDDLPEDLQGMGWRDLYEIGVTDKDDLMRLVDMIALKDRVMTKDHPNILWIFYEVLRISGLVERYTRNGDMEGLSNLGYLSRIIHDFDVYGRSKSTFVFNKYLHHMGEKAFDAVKEEDENCVRVMTVHQAKGLEFPVVVVGSVMENRFPRTRSEGRFPVPHELTSGGFETGEKVHIDDQRRLFYVGLTRARDLLLVGTADKVKRRGGGPSRFLKEIGLERFHCCEDLRSEPCESSCEEVVAERERPRLSYSTVSTYMQCPFRYYLSEEMGFRTTDWAMSVFGSSLHHTLEEMHKRAARGEELSEDIVEQIYEENWIPFGRRGKKREGNFYDKGLKYILGYFEAHQDRLKRVELIERRFNYPTEDFTLVGALDLGCRSRDGKGLEIYDFKTRTPKGIPIFNPRRQVEFYALGLEDTLDMPVTGLNIHILSTDEVKHYPWDGDRRRETEDLLGEVCRGIVKGDFPPRKSEFCNYCDYGRICPHIEDDEE